MTPVTGFSVRTIKCTLSVAPHLSGPNMITYGELGVTRAGATPSA